MNEWSHCYKNQTELDESRHWIGSVNRGGLTKISDEAFRSFCDIEIHIRKYLRVENMVTNGFSNVDGINNPKFANCSKTHAP